MPRIQKQPELIEGRDLMMGSVLYQIRRGGYERPRGYHTHMWEFWSSVQGTTTFAVGRRNLVIGPDQGVFIPPKVIHCQRVTTSQPCLGLTIHFVTKRPLRELTDRVLELSDWARAVMRQIIDTMGDGDLADAQRRSLWAMMLNEISFGGLTPGPLTAVNPLVVPTGREYALARRVVEQMRRWLDRPANLMADLCEVTGYSETQLRRLFQTQTGLSPLEAFQRLRLEEAIRLLQQSSLKIGAISHRLGFAHAYQFNRFFRQRMDCTPTEFLSSARGQGWTSRTRLPLHLNDEIVV